MSQKKKGPGISYNGTAPLIILWNILHDMTHAFQLTESQ